MTASDRIADLEVAADRKTAVEDEVRLIIARSVEGHDQFDVPNGASYVRVANEIAANCAWEVIKAVEEAAQARAKELDAEVERLREWSIALQDLTPGGSEYQTPAACLAFVRDVRNRQIDTFKLFKSRADEQRKRAEAAESRAAALEQRVKDLEAGLLQAEDAIAEFYRYWTGGETRGSYDGRPERDRLWRARQSLRALLTQEPSHD